MIHAGNIKSFLSGKGIYIILFVTTLIFINSLYNGFVWDDWVLIVPNEKYKVFDIKNIFLSKANALEYLPFRDLTLLIDYKLWGLNPFGYHLSNLLFYLLSLITLYKMVETLLFIIDEKDGELIPFLTTLVFALHPLHTEVVNFVAARNNILAGLFIFLSFTTCIKGIYKRNNFLIFVSALFFIISLFSKASVIFYPLFLGLILFLSPKLEVSIGKKIGVFLLFCILDLGGIIIHLKIASSTGVITENIPKYGIYNPATVIVKALQIPFFYLKKVIIPYPLSIKYPSSIFSTGIISLSGLIFAYISVITVLILALQKRSILIVVAIAWFFFSLIPVLNIFPTNPVVADRYAYFAVLSMGILTSCLIKWSTSKNLFIYLVTGILLIWAGIDISRNMDWKSDISLWSSTIKVNPDIPKSDLAMALWNEGRYNEALAYFKEDRDKRGSYEYSLYKGRYLYLSGKYEEAIKYYEASLSEGAGALKETHLFIAQAYEKIGSYISAIKHYLKVLDTKSQDPLGDYDKTAKEGISRIRERFMPIVQAARRKANNDPQDLQAQSRLAQLLYTLGMYSKAEAYYQRALEITPSRWDLWYNMGLTYMKMHRYEDAIDSFKKSLRLKPQNIRALRNIAISYTKMREYSDAIRYYKFILDINPDIFYATFNLGKIYFIKGDRENSKRYFLLARRLAGQNVVLLTKIELFLKELSNGPNRIYNSQRK